jgi:hypothetical protein
VPCGVSKTGHFDKFDEWKSNLSAVFVENGTRALAIKAAPYGSAKTFVALLSLIARCQQNRQRRIIQMEEVSAYGARQPGI